MIVRLLLFLACFAVGSATCATVSAQYPPKPAPAPAAKPIDVAGEWNMAMVTWMWNANVTLEFKQDAEKLTGTYNGLSLLMGRIKKNAIQFDVTLDSRDPRKDTPTKMTFWGEVAADGQSIIKGTAEIEGLGHATWTASRAR
jgi:hypothetical protein